MTKVAIPGMHGIYHGAWPGAQMQATSSGVPGVINSTINATNQKVHFLGHYVNAARAQRSITKIHVRLGTIVSAGGSLMRVSLQDVSASAGPPGRGDGTADQKQDILLSSLTQNAVNTFTLDANRTLNHGETVAVVLEFDPGGRLGSDSFQYSTYNTTQSAGGLATRGGVTTESSGGLFLFATALVSVVLEDTLGGYGTLAPGALVSAVGTHAFKQDTGTYDEYGVRFRLPYRAWASGIWVYARPTATDADFKVILSDATGTMLKEVAVDANSMRSSAAVTWNEIYFGSDQLLEANTTYHTTLQPTQTANTVELVYLDVSANAYLAVMSGGPEMYQASRLDIGTIDTLNTRVPMIGPIITAVDDGLTSVPGRVTVLW